MPNLNQFFLTKFLIISFTILQSFNCQADIIRLQKADSLFATQNYQESMMLYDELFHNEGLFSPAMLLKMAFVSEGRGDYSQASFYLAKYYDQNPNPRVISKIKALTEQKNLTGYELGNAAQLFKFVTDLKLEITGFFAFLLILSLIFLFVYSEKAHKFRHYLPSILFLILTFMANNFLNPPKTGIITGSPTLVMDKPTAGGKLINVVEPGHRVIVKSSKDIWYEVKWGSQDAYIRKESITRL